MLCDEGDWVLIEEWCYATSAETAKTLGCKLQPVEMDQWGMIPEKLEEILRDWKPEGKGKRPRVMYVVTV
jgi:aromatic amino acid aminotransferase I / 2-aminoadipate transaminase